MTRRPFDDNGAGVISYRAWLYAGNADGDTLRSSPSERYEKSAMTEAQLYAHIPLIVAPVVFVELDADRPDWREELARLSKNERRAWELQQGCANPEVIRYVGVPVGELTAMERRGYSVIEGTKRRLTIGEFQVECWDVEGVEYTEQGKSYQEIAAAMKATYSQVKRWLADAKRKLRGQ